MSLSPLGIDAVMSAMAAAADAKKRHDKALSKHNGYSWDYHGASYIRAVRDAEQEAQSVLEEYIGLCVQNALKKQQGVA